MTLQCWLVSHSISPLLPDGLFLGKSVEVGPSLKMTDDCKVIIQNCFRALWSETTLLLCVFITFFRLCGFGNGTLITRSNSLTTVSYSCFSKSCYIRMKYWWRIQLFKNINSWSNTWKKMFCCEKENGPCWNTQRQHNQLRQSQFSYNERQSVQQRDIFFNLF